MKTAWMYCATAVGLLGSLAVGCAPGSEETNSDTAANKTRAVTCTPEQQAKAAATMVTAPIKPPRSLGGVNLFSDEWKLLTLDEAEQTLCQSTQLSKNVESNRGTGGWGDANELVVDYDLTTKSIGSFQLNAGYRGTLDFKSRPTDIDDPSKPNPFGQHTYSIGIGQPIRRDGVTWELNWSQQCTDDANLNCWDKQSAELFDGLMYTFAPELASTQKSCIKAQTCLAQSFPDGLGIFGVRPLGIYLTVPSTFEAQPVPSTPGYMYGFAVKQLPFSSAELNLKLDAEGPVATARKLGTVGSNCSMKVGMPFQSFLGECVRVMGDASQNELLTKKTLGNAQHVGDTWMLDVTGARPNFKSGSANEKAIPTTSVATEIALDIRASGQVTNDVSGGTLTLAGSAAVYREFARLTQKFIHENVDPSFPKFPLGAPQCLRPADADAAWTPAKGCTGIEQLVTPASASTAAEPGVATLSVGPERATRLGMRTVLKPGDPRLVFCADPGVFAHCGQSGESSPSAGLSGTVMDTLTQVVTVLGNGDPKTLPAAISNHEAYVRLWTTALVKYLRAAPQNPTDLGLPAFDSLTPAPGDITIAGTGAPGEPPMTFRIKYTNRFEYTMNFGQIQQMTFR